ncbi:hypothetical protein Slin15195_G052240 [Septoria linicola]|uniref:Uncharacterized protein n=1 Tax=Septoria linicola TaxID=215465 RepID=A0A9Q9AMX1_9PEZI|nr:hypothetical protein Slin14017_G127720 [Septoria linicola]USW51905.1 hypothetical protein Slin15195_G052240 [Septoria linicola]
MDEHRKNGVLQVIPCPDPSRSPHGAWLLDAAIPFEILIPDMTTQGPTRTELTCFQQLGAIWDNDWFDQSQRASSYDSPSICRDATLSMYGEWTLPGELPVETVIPEMRSRDPFLSIADCFRLLGAAWCEDSQAWASYRASEHELRYFFLDPARTTRERVDRPEQDGDPIAHYTGVDYLGAWGMTMKQKAAADRLKEAHSDLRWSQRYAEAGGSWNWHYRRVDDEGGRTAEEIVGLDEDLSICAEHDRTQAHLRHMLALHRESSMSRPNL